jgi:hypothetical protein
MKLLKDKDFYSVREFWESIPICKGTFYTWLKEGLAPKTMLIKRRRFIARKDLDEWIATNSR